MQEPKSAKGGTTDEKDHTGQKPDADATSKETVSDLDASKENGGSSGSKAEPGPSPDGVLDESDENKDAGPM